MNANDWQKRFMEASKELAWLSIGESHPGEMLSEHELALLEELEELEFQAGRDAMQARPI
jgi:hypothetical protein